MSLSWHLWPTQEEIPVLILPLLPTGFIILDLLLFLALTLLDQKIERLGRTIFRIPLILKCQDPSEQLLARKQEHCKYF